MVEQYELFHCQLDTEIEDPISINIERFNIRFYTKFELSAEFRFSACLHNSWHVCANVHWCMQVDVIKHLPILIYGDEGRERITGHDPGAGDGLPVLQAHAAAVREAEQVLDGSLVTLW